jgi:hypothetical protein
MYFVHQRLARDRQEREKNKMFHALLLDPSWVKANREAWRIVNLALPHRVQLRAFFLLSSSFTLLYCPPPTCHFSGTTAAGPHHHSLFTAVPTYKFLYSSPLLPQTLTITSTLVLIYRCVPPLARPRLRNCFILHLQRPHLPPPPNPKSRDKESV